MISESYSTVQVAPQLECAQGLFSLGAQTDGDLFANSSWAKTLNVDTVTMTVNTIDAAVYVNSPGLEVSGVLTCNNGLDTVLMIPNLDHTAYPTVLRFTSGLLTSVDVFDLEFTMNTSYGGNVVSGVDQFLLPLISTGQYDFYVYWGDDSFDHITAWNDGAKLHTFTGGPGEYTVRVVGSLQGWRFANGGDCDKMVSVDNWFTGFRVGTVEGNYFQGCSYMTVNNTVDLRPLNLEGTVSLAGMFSGCYNLNDPNFETWDTSGVTNMSFMFSESSFAGYLSTWDTSAVTDMSYMFNNAFQFASPLGDWDVSNVQTMQDMFYGCYNFNQPLTHWNPKSVVDMSEMFSECSTFNQPLGHWDVSSVISFSYTFYDCLAFNQNLNSWNTESATTMEFMFFYSAFNSPVYNWNTSKVTAMTSMFQNSLFNQSVNTWDVSQVIDMEEMFRSSPFNKPLHRWNVSSVAYFDFMFGQCSYFNQPINTWDISGAISLSNMFFEAYAFNQPLSNWNLENVFYLTGMFFYAVAFKQNLATWSPYQVQNMNLFLDGVDINTEGNQDNYNALLVSWGTNKINNFVPYVLNFSGGNSQYTDAVAGPSRQALIDTLGWTITDGGGV